MVIIGEVNMQVFRFREAVSALEHAEELGEVQSLPRLLKVISWICDWKRYEFISHQVEKEAKKCYNHVMQSSSLSHGGQGLNTIESCQIDSTLALEFTDVNGAVHKLFHKHSPNSVLSPLQCQLPPIPASIRSHMNNRNHQSGQVTKYRLKIGILSADFGVHPVSTLIRGGLHFIDRSRIEMYCFSLDPNLSYWGINISKTVEHFHVLTAMNTFDAAQFVASFGIDILIDLNGHTLHTGLKLMTHKIAYLQLSFLGLPTTTGASFIDYYLSDWISTPTEAADHFSEKLLLMPPCYIVNGMLMLIATSLFIYLFIMLLFFYIC